MILLFGVAFFPGVVTATMILIIKPKKDG